MERSQMNQQPWLDLASSFIFSGLGRVARDWYFAARDGKTLPRRKLISAALYSSVTGLAIAMLLMWRWPQLQGSLLIFCVSLLAGISAVDLADIVLLAFKSWARKIAGIENEKDEK